MRNRNKLGLHTVAPCTFCTRRTVERQKSAWEVQWLEKCAESLIQLLDFEGLRSSDFEAGNYCDSCTALLRDIDFTVRTAATLESRLSHLRRQIAHLLIGRLNSAVEATGSVDENRSVSSAAAVNDADLTPSIVAVVSLNEDYVKEKRFRKKKRNQNSTAVSARTRNATKIPFPDVNGDAHEDGVNDAVHGNGVKDEVHGNSVKDEAHDNGVNDDVNGNGVNGDEVDNGDEDDFEIGCHDNDCDSDEDFVPETSRKRLRSNQSQSRNGMKSKKRRGNSDVVSETVDLKNEKSKSQSDLLKNQKSQSDSLKNQKAKLSELSEKELMEKLKTEVALWKLSEHDLEKILTVHVTEQFGNESCTTSRDSTDPELLVYLLRSELEEHYHAIRTFVCTVPNCTARFRAIGQLRRHLSLEHGQGLDLEPLECFVCQHRFLTDVILNTHLRAVHGGDSKPHHCEVQGCTNSYSDSSALIRHTKKFHPEFESELGIGRAPYYNYRDTAAMVRAPFLNQRKRARQSKAPHTFSCTVHGCPYRSATDRDLTFHKLEVHDKDPLPYPCGACGKAYKTRKSYDSHPCVAKAVHQCEHCGRVFRSQFRLTLHKKMKHKDAQQYKCAVCERCYFRPEDVSAHERLHTPETGFNCVLNACASPACESLEGLRAHVVGPLHDGTQKCRICDICGYVSKGMKASERMKEHVRTHTAEAPFACRFCDKRFKTRPVLKSHEEINHPDLVERRIYACKLCSETFTVAQYLFKHNAWHKYGSNACRPIAKKKT